MMMMNNNNDSNDNPGGDNRVETTTEGTVSPVFRSMSLDALQPAPAVAVLSRSFSSQNLSGGTKDENFLEPRCDDQEPWFMAQVDDPHQISVAQVEGWAKPAQLTPLPMYHPSSLHHATVSMWHLEHALDQLMHSFRILSLQAVFYDQPVLSCCCRSMDQVELCIHLWKIEGRDCTDEKVLIEIQRTAGDAMASAKYIRYLLDVLEQVQAQNPTSTPWGRPEETHEEVMMQVDRDEAAGQKIPSDVVMMPLDPFRCPSLDRLAKAEAMIFGNQMQGDDKLRHQLPSMETQQRSALVDEALEIVSSLLRTDRYDARCLGLQSCVIMTDPEKSGPSTAQAVARCILLSPEQVKDHAGFRTIHDRIFHLIMTGLWPDQWEMEDDDDEEKMVESAGFDIHSHAFLALTVVAQAVTLLDGDELTRFIQCCWPSRDVSLMPRLTELVLTASTHPHTAYLATHILATLCPHSQALCRSIPLAVVTRAQQVGMVRHKALEVASSRLLLFMQA